MQCPAELRRLADQIASAPDGVGGDDGRRGCCKAFLDIGGDRESGAVVRMIFAVVDAIGPGLIVVKSRNLFAALVPLIPHASGGTPPPPVGPGNAAWLAAMRALAAPGPDAPLPPREPARLSQQARRAARRAASAESEGGGGPLDQADCAPGSARPMPATATVAPTTRDGA